MLSNKPSLVSFDHTIQASLMTSANAIHNRCGLGVDLDGDHAHLDARILELEKSFNIR